ncbi:MAG: response regulator [Polyangiaceae bacterium]
MPSTVLAVDDSVTMRKVLEITFAGPEFNVITADSADAALAKLKSAKADVIVADSTLDPKTGYDLCKLIKAQSPGVPVLILSSKQHPFDPAKGSAAQADDHIDKPFDTQQMIDKVKKLLSGGKAEPVAAAAAPARPAVANPLAQTIIGQGAPTAQAGRTMPGPAAVPAQASPSPTATGQVRAQRAQTLVYNPGVAMPPVAGSPPAAQARPLAPTGRPGAVSPTSPTPAAGVTRPSGPAPAASPTTPSLGLASEIAHMAAHGPAAGINGQMAAKLEELGLTPAQVDAVVALSREVVERVVWEVVPVLAETIIKEEIARLTK